MAASLPQLANTALQQTLPILAIGYLVLISILALTAVFSSKPHRRRAALDVLKVLLPGRRDRASPAGANPRSRSTGPPSEHSGQRS